MTQHDDGEIVPQGVEIVQKLPNALRQIHPLVIALFLHPAHFISDHQPVQRVDDHDLDLLQILLRVDLVEDSAYCGYKVGTKVVVILLRVLTSPSLPRQALLVAIQIECLFRVEIPHSGGLPAAGLAHDSKYA